MKTKIISISLLLFIITSVNKAQEWEFVGLDSLLIKQIFVSGDTIWTGTISRIDTSTISGVYRSINKGLSWVRIDSSLGKRPVICLDVDLKSATIWLVKQLNNISPAGTLFKSSNRGEDWQLINQLEAITIDWLGISIFNNKEMYAKQFTYITAGEYETIYRSLDGGNNWKEITFFPSSSHGRSLSFNLSSVDSNILYASVDDRMFDTYFFKSTNKGNNWLYISEPPAVEQELITDPNSPNSIFIFSGYHFTEDDGYSWSVADSGLADVTSYLSFYVDPLDKTTFYNLRKDGLFVSKNNPIQWQLVEESDSLPLNLGSQGFQNWDIGQLSNIFIDTLTKEIFVGTAKGIYKKDLVTSLNETQNDMHSFVLNQNFPNPFNPVTTISYRIPEFSFVTIKVFDLLGREIETLVKEEKLAGEYQIQFFSKELPSGVYIYELNVITENGRRIREGKKMLLIK